MEIRLTSDALAFLKEKGRAEITVASLVFSSCCSGPLPPEVKPGAPLDPFGFGRLEGADGVTVYFDSLLEPKPLLTIGLKNFGTYRELYVDGWE